LHFTRIAMPQPLSGNLFDLFIAPTIREFARAVERFATAGSAKARGALFTRSVLVEFIFELRMDGTNKKTSNWT